MQEDGEDEWGSFARGAASEPEWATGNHLSTTMRAVDADLQANDKQASKKENSRRHGRSEERAMKGKRRKGEEKAENRPEMEVAENEDPVNVQLRALWMRRVGERSRDEDISSQSSNESSNEGSHDIKDREEEQSGNQAEHYQIRKVRSFFCEKDSKLEGP